MPCRWIARGDQLLASAGLSGDEDGGRGVSDLTDELVHAAHRGRSADQLVEALVPRELVPEVPDLPLERPALQGAIDHAPQVVRGERLGQVVVGAELHRLHRRPDGADRRDEHHLQAGVEALDPLEHLDPFHAGEPHVEKADVHVAAPDALDRGGPVRGLHHVTDAVEHHLHGHADSGLVVDDEHDGARLGAGGQRTRPAGGR